MATKTVRLEFDTAITDGSGEKIRSQLEDILKGIGSAGLELQSVKVSQSAISSLRSQIQNGLKDIPITFKASDIATSTGVIAANAGTARKSAQKEMNDLLKQYEAAEKNWKKSLTGGKFDDANKYANQAKAIAAQYKEVAAANKNLISQEDALAKLAEKRKNIVGQLTTEIRTQRQQQKQAAEEQVSKRQSSDAVAAAKEQAALQKQLTSMLKEYKKIETEAQNAALTGKGDASGLAQQAKDQAAAYEQLAQSITNAEERQRAFNNLAQTQAGIIRQTTSAMEAQETKQQTQLQKDMDKELESYRKAQERLQKARAKGDTIGEASATIDVEKHAERYRQLADSIEDVAQRTEALNQIEQVEASMNAAGTAALEKKTAAQNANTEAKKRNQEFSEMTSGVDAEIQKLNASSQSLIRNTEAFKNWEAAKKAYGKTGSADDLEAVKNTGKELEKIVKSIQMPELTLGKSLGGVFTKLSSMLKASAFAAATKAIRDMVSAVRELDSALTQMQIVTGGTDTDIENFSVSIAQTSKEIGSSITDLVDSATVFARLGYSESESTALAKYTSMMSNVGKHIA